MTYPTEVINGHPEGNVGTKVVHLVVRNASVCIKSETWIQRAWQIEIQRHHHHQMQREWRFHVHPTACKRYKVGFREMHYVNKALPREKIKPYLARLDEIVSSFCP